MPETPELSDPAPRYLWPAGLFVAGLCVIPIFQCKKALDDLGDWPTQNVLIKETPSPDGKLRLVEYIRRAGVMTDDVREFSILEAKQPLPDDNGNVFRLNAKILGVHGFPEARPSPVKARWIRVDRVEIAYPEGIEVIAGPISVEVDVEGAMRRIDVSARPYKATMKRRSAGSVNQN